MSKTDGTGSNATDVVRSSATNILMHFENRSDEVIEERIAACIHRGDMCGEEMWHEIKAALKNVRRDLPKSSEAPEGSSIYRPDQNRNQGQQGSGQHDQEKTDHQSGQ